MTAWFKPPLDSMKSEMRKDFLLGQAFVIGTDSYLVLPSFFLRSTNVEHLDFTVGVRDGFLFFGGSVRVLLALTWFHRVFTEYY